MGQADDLRSHDDIVRTLCQIGQADIFSAVMENRGDLQKEPLSLSKAVHPFHAVKNGQGNLFKGFAPFPASPVSLTDILGAGYNIFLKVVGRGQDMVLLCIFVGNAVAQRHPWRPYLFCTHVIHDRM